MAFDFSENPIDSLQESVDFIADGFKYKNLADAVDLYGTYKFYDDMHQFMALNGTELSIDYSDPIRVMRSEEVHRYQSTEYYMKECCYVLPTIQLINMLLDFEEYLPDSLQITSYNNILPITKGGHEIIYSYDAYEHGVEGGNINASKLYNRNNVLDYNAFITRPKYTRPYHFNMYRYKRFYKIMAKHYKGRLVFYSMFYTGQPDTFVPNNMYSASVRLGMFMDNTKEEWIDFLKWSVDNFSPNFIWSCFFMIYICDNLIHRGFISGDMLADKIRMFYVNNTPWARKLYTEHISTRTWTGVQGYEKIAEIFTAYDMPETPGFQNFLVRTLYELITC